MSHKSLNSFRVSFPTLALLNFLEPEIFNQTGRSNLLVMLENFPVLFFRQKSLINKWFSEPVGEKGYNKEERKE